jgi:hypothetical protein
MRSRSGSPASRSCSLGDAFVYVCTIQRMAINLFRGQGVH